MSSAPVDLEIFILTYNRADMLKRAIESCLRQTIKGVQITVLDNASTDHTQEVVAEFNDPNISFVGSSENIGGLNNMKRCQTLCKKSYVMIFHDDDQLHPEYIEKAYRAMTEHPEATIAVANATTIDADSVPDFVPIRDQHMLNLDKVHFAAALYGRNKIAFCSAIYRRDSLVSVDFASMVEQYGKWGDRPILIDAVGSGTAIMFESSYVYSGRHDSQDTHQKMTQPVHTLWLNREKFFRELLGEKMTTFTGICFLIMNHRRLKSGFKRRIRNDLDFKSYLRDAFFIGATSPRSWRFRWLAIRPIQSCFNRYAAKYLRKNFNLVT